MKGKTFNFSRPLVIGHRGFPAQYPENTMVSFMSAVDAGVGMIELDITLSRDSEIVVIHDDTLDRTTNGSGLVSDFTLQALRKFDAGSWFDKKFAGQKIPTIDEILDSLVNKVMINVEIKQTATGSSSYVELIVEKLLAVVEARDAKQRILISSFDPEILKAVTGSQHHPEVALLLEEAIDENALALAEGLGAMSIHSNVDTLDTETVNKVRARRFLVFPYNVDSEIKVRRAINMDVDGLFVDDPVMAMVCCQNRPASFSQAENYPKR